MSRFPAGISTMTDLRRAHQSAVAAKEVALAAVFGKEVPDDMESYVSALDQVAQGAEKAMGLISKNLPKVAAVEE